ncbi:MAG: translation initiation factor IF-1 [Candidatus Paceibacterota bacterium]|jgi:translation initiation factor IF-1
MIESEETKATAVGTVEEVLPNSLFRVRLSKEKDQSPEASENGDAVEEGELLLAYLAGKMRLHRIRVLVGDQVDMVLDPYGGKARIVRRLT